MNSSWGSYNNVLSLFQLSNVFLHDGTSNARVNLEVAVLTEGLDDDSDLDGKLSGWRDDKGLAVISIWVNRLECSNRKGSCFTSSRLSLSDRILALNHGKNSLLLDGGWLLETISENTSEDFLSKTEVFKFID